MAIDRRSFLRLGLGVAAAALLPPLHASTERMTLLSCRTDHLGRHFLSYLTEAGERLFDIELPERGHGVAVDPQQRLAAVFARRPGYYIWIVDLQTAQVVKRIEPREDRHFFGHGLFTPDGKTLLVTENDFTQGVGVIGQYEVTNDFARIGEVPSHGVGPHEIGLLSNGTTLVVANGGIQTHPDLPRIKTNLAEMRPNLAYVDLNSGELLQSHEPEARWHQLSIRHIDIAADDTVAIAMQYQGRLEERPPVVALQRGDGSLQMLSAPEEVQRRFENYAGSVEFSRNGERFAVSTPKGGVVAYWSRHGEYLGCDQQPDVCGLAPDPKHPAHFISSDGTGLVVGDLANGKRALTISDARWDNHMVALLKR